ncbi:TolB family protein [Micromonospora sp. LOL_023]|uniref:TolB family protein n=1 Tax=Micromonospora sp. LOL_023 TaxID=3345418 RepID=UPI003A83933C
MISLSHRRPAARPLTRLLSITAVIAGSQLPISPAAASMAPPGDIQADQGSRAVAVSQDGRYAYFHSAAKNLAPGLATSSHLYRRDLRSSATELVDISHVGSAPSAGVSGAAFTSADGRWVMFLSRAGNLVPTDRNGIDDIFIRDMDQQTTELVSVATDGTQANGWSGPAGLSDDGRFAVFQSNATNLVAGGTPAGVRHIYVRDRLLGTTEVVTDVPATSIAPGWSPMVSADGRSVAYDLYLPGPSGAPLWTTIIHDLTTGATEFASVATDGTRANAQSNVVAVGGDGDFVLLRSDASNLVYHDTNGYSDVFVRNLKRGITKIASLAYDGSQADGPSIAYDISDNGRYVAFGSAAANLMPGDTNGVPDVFVRDRRDTGVTHLVSVAADGSPANGPSDAAAISAQGRFVLFSSSATNLVDGDTNGYSDVFLRNLATGTTVRVSVG